MHIKRCWAMPNKNTFSIKPIYLWIEEIMGNIENELWIDPFVRNSVFKKLMSSCNDLNPSIEATYNITALSYLKTFDDNCIDGIFFDPPYSPRQIKECYNGIGLNVTQKDTQSSFYSSVKDEIARILKPKGKVMSFGWNSSGIGKKRGFKIHNILLVSHGSYRNDTICTFETKL